MKYRIINHTVEPVFSEEDKILLTEYTEFLIKEGYCNDDSITAVDKFVHPKLYN